MRERFLPFSPPLIGEEEIAEVVDTLRSDWITTGPKTKLFEEKVAGYLGVPGALALNSCTAGLHTALVSLGIKAGDEVITTPMTFAASCNVIEHVGAKPVLVDIQSDTLNIDPRMIERAITPNTRAIIPVHYAGHPVDLDAIGDLANKYKLSIVEDAAHALSAKYKGKYIGSHGNPAAFSFYATKNLTTGEGGMLTGSGDFIERARIVSLHGMSKDAWKRYDQYGAWYYDIVMPGFKYNMTDIQASIGLCQLKKLSEFQLRRQQIVKKYNEAFSQSDSLQVPVEHSNVEHAWHLYVLRINENSLSIDRDRMVQELKQRNIGTSVHFIPLYMHSYYKNKYSFKADDFPVATENFKRIISLPLNPRLTDRDVDDVIEVVLDVVKQFRL